MLASTHCSNPAFFAPYHRRAGKILVLFAVLLTSLFAVIAYVLDGGMMLLHSRQTQHAADAAATAAAVDLFLTSGGTSSSAAIIAEQFVQAHNAMPAASVTTRTPPVAGQFSGLADYVEVVVNRPYEGYFLRPAGMTESTHVNCRAVAGRKPSTGPAAVVVLDPDPPTISLGPLPLSLPSLTPLLGGLEVLGLGKLRVNGAIHVNNEWSGLDENGDPVGSGSWLKSSCSCTPLLPLTKVRATDLRVVGGVDDPSAYGPLIDGDPSPLRADRLPVPDPYGSLPVPTTAVDSTNVRANLYGHVTVINLPLLQPPRVLNPGIYDSLQIVSGRVIFNPGVYIIRGVNPVTQIGLSILTGTIDARGVMFYLTNATSYDAGSGYPDAADGETIPPNPGVTTLLPSAIIDIGLLNSRFSALDDPASPFDGLLIYQRRTDRRPILIVQQTILGAPEFSGNVYAKWGHVVLAAQGTYRSAFAVGSLRVLTVLQTVIEPQVFLPPAYDVYLVE